MQRSNRMNSGGSKPHVPISQEFQVRTPVEEEGFMVSDGDWKYLKDKVDEITTGSLGYHTFGSVAAGVAGSALVGALSIPTGVSFFETPSMVICWGIFLISVISSAMAFWYAHQQKGFVARSKRDAVAEMDRIEARCPRKGRQSV